MWKNLLGFLVLAGTSITYKVMLFIGCVEVHELAIATAISGIAAVGLYEHINDVIKENENE